MLSRAFSKSIKLVSREDCPSILCSTMTLRVAIWSIQRRPARNPACYSLSFSSSAVLIRSKITLQNILPAIFNSMMPRQFSLWLISPFFGSLISRPFFHSSGTCSSFHIRLQRSKITSYDTLPPSLIASGGILSQPTAFPLFNFFIALLISTGVMRPVLMFNSSPGSTYGGLGGSSWFSTLSKCSLDLCFSFSAVLSNTPASFLTGLHVLWNLPFSFLVISYKVLSSSPPFSLLCSLSAIDFTYTVLSLLQLFFTFLFIPWCLLLAYLLSWPENP